MTALMQARLDLRLRRVHKRWAALAEQYERTYGDITPAVFYALFDRAVGEVPR